MVLTHYLAGEPVGVALDGVNMYRVRHDTTSPYTDFKPRYNPALRGPPEVFPAFGDPVKNVGKITTPMSRYGWTAYLRTLNPGKLFDVAVHKGLAMFNSPNTWAEGGDKMESLLFGGNLVWAVESGTYGWARIITLDYESGPPAGMPTYDENPLFVQKFTMIWRGGKVTSRVPALYYPVVARYPIYMRWSWLEPFGPDMETTPPP
jgi:hypothetical protein